MIDIDILQAAVMDSRDGITISDGTHLDNPLIFVNPAFERMTGYSFEEVEGKNCRCLQGAHRDQEDRLSIIRQAIQNSLPCLVTLRNYRKDGSMFWNELSLSPIFDSEGKLRNYLGIQKDVTSKILLEEQLKGENKELKQSNTMLQYLINIDSLTGVYNRRYLEQQLEIQWKIAIRQKQKITIFMLDIDFFKKYNDTYGHPAGDDALKKVADILNHSFLKSTDFVARYGGEEFIILTIGGDQEQIALYADTIVKKISDLNIVHDRSDKAVLTVSLGFSSCWPKVKESSFSLIKQADEALYEAKGSGRNKAINYANLMP